ncbi:hypothetical protein L208DRAFT_936921 [Tricholoma matsutake]|nr:hypothetical protein L208DRAFT_936921 [Tricholoma matsutake 945]
MNAELESRGEDICARRAATCGFNCWHCDHLCCQNPGFYISLRMDGRAFHPEGHDCSLRYSGGDDVTLPSCPQ